MPAVCVKIVHLHKTVVEESSVVFIDIFSRCTCAGGQLGPPAKAQRTQQRGISNDIIPFVPLPGVPHDARGQRRW